MSIYPYDKNCAKCGSAFTIKASWQKNNVFCSHACSNDARRIYSKEDCCINCGKTLGKYQRKFCSQSCAASVNNRIYPKRKALPKLKKEKPTSKVSKIPGRFRCRCKHCGFIGDYEKARFYCDEHIGLYSHSGRARYWFTLNVYSYPELFDLVSLTRIGFRSTTNPNGYTRDHRVSVNEAIRNGYDPYYITHVMNCELMLWPENNRKKTRSSITYEELVKMVDDYDSKLVGAPGIEPGTMGLFIGDLGS